MTNYVLVIAGLMLILSGCSSQPRAVIAINSQFMLVQARQNDSYQAIAASYLGSRADASIIQRYNPGLTLSAGAVIAIPRGNPNPSGVYSNGYQMVPILCYHQFTRQVHDSNSMVVTERHFRQQMAYLKDSGYKVIPLTDIRLFLAGKKPLPDKSVVLTVDDGHKSFMTVAYPILKKYGFPATLFVYPDFIGAGIALNWDDVKKLDDDPLISIQSHSKTHGSMARKPTGETMSQYLARLKTEVQTTDQIFIRRLGHGAKIFAYPYGNSSPQAIVLLEKNHYQLGLTVNKGSVATFSPPFLLHRTMIYGADSLAIFKRQLRIFTKADLR